MSEQHKLSLVSTVRERCRVCYTCVRECPAEAIRIVGGQAEVIDERCIGCGNCVRVCSQQAKRVYSSVAEARALLAAGGTVAACLAPSFAAEFTDLAPELLVAMTRRLGFSSVHEVAFGADLVAAAYRRLLAERPADRFVATTCPAVTSYVERFHPDLVSSLAPIVSPMVATARALRALHGPALRVVFVGPCLAKKEEAVATQVEGEIDCVLTFAELRLMLAEAGITPVDLAPTDFDPPFGGTGALFPLSRGMLQAAGIAEDLIQGDVVAADGRTGFQNAIREREAGALDAHLLEVLCCAGCVMGPGMTTTAPLFARRAAVSRHVRLTVLRRDGERWRADCARLAALDLGRGYAADDQRLRVPAAVEVDRILARMGKLSPADHLNCGACGYDTCREHAQAIDLGLAESEMCLPYTIDQLRVTVEELAVSHRQLASTQEALLHTERLASMGQLAAGIAHEVNNPLGVVLMYAHLLLEETPASSALRPDLETIVEQTDRAKRIVAGLLNFARQSKATLVETDLRALVDRALRSATVPPGITVEVVHADPAPTAELDGDKLGQVLINLITNAVAAMAGAGTLRIGTAIRGDQVRIEVSDSGVGIPPENRDKVFLPFFTTKPAGEGTGLGLAVSYGIVTMHRGTIRVESNTDPAAGPTGTTFTVVIPARTVGHHDRAGEPAAAAQAAATREGTHVQ